jgi:hypothetical protein
VAVPQARLDVGAEGAGPQVGHQRGVVDVADPVEAAQVEGHAAEQRDRGAAHAAATTGRRDRHPGGVAQGEHGRHLGGVGGSGHQRGPGRHGAGGRPSDGQRPPVPAGLGPVLVQVGHRVADVGQAAGQVVVDGHPAPCPSRSVTSSGPASIGVTGVGWVTTRPPRRRRHRPGLPPCDRPAASVRVEPGPGQVGPQPGPA